MRNFDRVLGRNSDNRRRVQPRHRRVSLRLRVCIGIRHRRVEFCITLVRELRSTAQDRRLVAFNVVRHSVEEHRRRSYIGHEEEDAELSEHRNVQLQVDRVRVDISGDSGWREERAGS